jgi:uncharacterized protein (TIGR03067 family)
MSRKLAALFLLLAPPLLAAEPEGDLKALQGTWVVADAMLGGRDHTDDFKKMKLTVTGEKYTITLDDLTETGTIKIDDTKTPKQIDFATKKTGVFKGRTLPGIYELRGDTVVVCMNSEMPDRPTKFETPEKTKIMLMTFKREKK